MTLDEAAELKALMLASPPLTLAVAESLTCGGLQARIGAVSGASHFFRGGLTAYSLDAKVKLLRVERSVAAPVDAVSAEVARQMARGACNAFDATLAVATTGYAEKPPAPGGPDPFAFWALVHRQREGDWVERSGRIVCGGRATRTQVQAMVSDAVLGELMAYLRAWRGR